MMMARHPDFDVLDMKVSFVLTNGIDNTSADSKSLVHKSKRPSAGYISSWEWMGEGNQEIIQPERRG